MGGRLRWPIAVASAALAVAVIAIAAPPSTEAAAGRQLAAKAFVTPTPSVTPTSLPGALPCTDAEVVRGTVEADGPANNENISSSNFSGAYLPWHAFDDNPQTLWLSKTWEAPAYVGRIAARGGAAVTGYQIRFANGPSLTTRAPNTWSLQGSNNLQVWQTVDKVVDQTDWAGSETRSFNVAEPGVFSWYRLLVQSDNDDRSNIVVVSIADLKLYRGCEFSDEPDGPDGGDPDLPPTVVVRLDVAARTQDCPDSFFDATDGPGRRLEAYVGDVVTYCVWVRNLGPVPSEPLEVGIDGVGSAILPGLAPDDDAFVHGSLAVTEGMAQPLATLTYDIGDGAGAYDSDEAAINISRLPDLRAVVSFAPGRNGCPANYAEALDAPTYVTDSPVYQLCVNVANYGGTATNIELRFRNSVLTTIDTLRPEAQAAFSGLVTVDGDQPVSTTSTVTINSTTPDGTRQPPVSVSGSFLSFGLLPAS